MASNLSRSARRVQDALAERGFAFDVEELPDSTRTAADAASAIGCTVPQIAKSLVFRGADSGDPVLVIAGGANRVDPSKVAGVVGEEVDMADPDYVRERTGFAIGGVPPVGHDEALRTVIDEDLLEHEQIWAAAGTPNAVFALPATALPDLTSGTVTSIRESE